jgi:hypothetical protein
LYFLSVFGCLGSSAAEPEPDPGAGARESVIILPPGSGSINSELRIWIRILTIYQNLKKFKKKVQYVINFKD